MEVRGCGNKLFKYSTIMIVNSYKYLTTSSTVHFKSFPILQGTSGYKYDTVLLLVQVAVWIPNKKAQNAFIEQFLESVFFFPSSSSFLFFTLRINIHGSTICRRKRIFLHLQVIKCVIFFKDFLTEANNRAKLLKIKTSLEMSK